MADSVQFVLDKLVPTFRLAEDLDVFSEAEVKAIIKKTRDFEYVLKRRELYPDDFMTYIRYEINIEKLQTMRCNAKSARGTKEQMNAFRHLQALTIKHICYIFDRAVRRFPGEQSLWDDYISFLQTMKSYSILNTIFGRSLALNPKWDHLWIQAAVHEMNHNSNAHASRVLYQTGLRKNPRSERLWLRYFEFEIWQVCRVNERRKLLDLDDSEAVTAALTDKSSSIPVVIFKHAMTALDNSIGCAIKMHKIVSTISAEVTSPFEVELKKVFGGRTVMWQYLCDNVMTKYHINGSESGAGKRKGKGKMVSVVDQLDELALGVNQCLALLLEAETACSIEDTVIDQYTPLMTKVVQELVSHLDRICSIELDFSVLVAAEDDDATPVTAMKGSKRMRVDMITSSRASSSASTDMKAKLLSYFSSSVADFLSSVSKLQNAVGNRLVEYTTLHSEVGLLLSNFVADTTSIFTTAVPISAGVVPNTIAVSIISDAVMINYHLVAITGLFQSIQQCETKTNARGKSQQTQNASSPSLLATLLPAEDNIMDESSIDAVASCLSGLADLLLAQFSSTLAKPIVSNNNNSPHITVYIKCWCTLASQVLSTISGSDVTVADKDKLVQVLTAILQRNKSTTGSVTTSHKFLCYLCFNNSPVGVSFLLSYFQILSRHSAVAGSLAAQATVISCIQDVIKCPFVHHVPSSGVGTGKSADIGGVEPVEEAPLATRVDWCCLLLKYSTLSCRAGDAGISALRNIHLWVSKCRQMQPQYWLSGATGEGLDMDSYYQLLCGLVESYVLTAGNAQAPKDLHIQVAQQLKPFVKEAVGCCANGSSDWSVRLVELERTLGYHHKASHLEWQKR